MVRDREGGSPHGATFGATGSAFDEVIARLAWLGLIGAAEAERFGGAETDYVTYARAVMK